MLKKLDFGEMKRKKRIAWILAFFALQLASVSAQVGDTVEATRFLTLATEQIDSSDYEKGIANCDKAIQIYESVDAQYYKLGYAYNLKGDGFYEAGQYDKAIAYFMNARDILSNHYKTVHTEIAQSINFLGLCHWRKGNLGQAANFFQEGLDMRRQLLGHTHTKVADSYNNLGNIALAQRALSKALTFYQKALAIRTETLGEQHLDVASSYNNMGSCFRYAGEFETAIQLYTKSLNIRQSKLGKDHPKSGQNFLNLGDCFSQMGQIDSALVYLNQALQIFKTHYPEDHIELANVNINLGNCYSALGNHTQARSFFEKSLVIQVAHYQKDSPNLISVYNSLATTFEKQGDYQKALGYLENNLHILNTNPSFGAEHPFTGFTFTNIGTVQMELGQYDAALTNFSKAYAIYTARNDEEKIAETFNSIGNCLMKQGNYWEAIRNFKQGLELLKSQSADKGKQALIVSNIGYGFYEMGELSTAYKSALEALQLMEKQYGENSPNLASFKTNIAQILVAQEKYKVAFQQFEEVNTLIGIDLNNPKVPSYMDEPIDVLRLLNANGSAHLAYYQKNKNEAVLSEALTLFNYAIRVTEQVRNQYQEVTSKRQLGETSHESFIGAIQTCYQLYQITQQENYLEQAFQYSEKSRSHLILAALNTSNATSFSGIPDSLLAQERSLKSTITFYEKKKQIAIQKGSAVNQDLLDEYNHKIFQNKQLYEQLIQRFETEFPAYFELKYEENLSTIADLQLDLLTPDHSLIEYFVADTSTFVFVINKDKASMAELPIGVDTLAKKVSLLRKYIHAYYTDTKQQTGDTYQKALTDYTFLGYDLYQKIVQPIENQLAVKLTVINGSILNFLPFDALIASPVKQVHQPKSYNYLLKNYEISYGYSANLLHRLIKEKQSKRKQQLLAFAPIFSNTDYRNLAPLAHNFPEVDAITKLITGDVFTGPKATKTKFQELAHLYQIIHLSTHGQSDMEQGDYSYLAFAENADSTQEDLLYAKDIYNLDLQADLVVLSACETGTGEVSRSEGAISLGRAFFYSGAKSILNTLWSVDDASTGELMQQFYRDIRDGFTRSTALRKAKLNFIEEGKYAHPYYWSAFMLIGKRGEIQLDDGFNWQRLFIPSLLSLVGIGWLVFVRLKNSKQS